MLKDIQVHLDGGPLDDTRLAHAALIASAFGAHLTALFTNPLPDYVYSGDPAGSAVFVIANMRDEAVKRGDVIEARLKTQLAALNVPADLRRVEDIMSGIEAKLAKEARWADLFIASRPSPGETGQLWRLAIESVLFGAGRAVYLVPDAGVAALPEKPVLCWNDSREATRALAEAMPFLSKAARVTVAIADPDTGAGSDWREPAADVARHLTRHGVKPDLVEIASGKHTIAEALLHAAGERGADLIVIGGYGHSRFREWALGGVTRDMMAMAKVPLLLAH